MLHSDGNLTIDLGALAHNYAVLRARVGEQCRVAVSVKANAYGLGAKEVTGAALDAGCRDFFVAKPAEGIELRSYYKDARIYILNGFYTSYATAYKEHDLMPVIGSFMEIDAYKIHCAQEGCRPSAFLKFNTRMNRLGFGAVEQDALWEHPERLDGLDVMGVMSHLACADEPENPMNEMQREIFEGIAARFPEAIKSLANSSGIFLGPPFHYDMVRPGIALYGGNTVPGQPNPMRPVVSLDIPVTRTRLVYEGASVGYNATHRFDKETPLAILAAGYADGIFRSLSNQGAFYWRGGRCPIRGRVSMDLTCVDLSRCSSRRRPKPGDMLELLGSHQSIDDLGRDAGTVGYEILTNLGYRYNRIYKR